MTFLPPLAGRWGRPPQAALFLALAAGGACTVAWVTYADAALVWQHARTFNWWLALPAVALTLANVAVRFIRWQFFLRRAGVRLPIRESAGIFVGGLAMLLTPAYAGEGVKTWLVGRAHPSGWPKAAGVVIAERLFDAIALGLVGGAALLLDGEPALGAALGAAGLLGLAAAYAAGRSAPGLYAVVARLRGGGAHSSVPEHRSFTVDARGVGIALLLSTGAWLAGCLTLFAVCLGLHIDVTPAQAVGTYSASTLLGGLTLLPAGVGVVGTAILVKLQGYGVSLQQAVLAAVLVRLLTVWLTAAIGVAGCWRLWHRLRHLPSDLPSVAGGHFDTLAPDYAGQFSPAARERVVARKVAIMTRALAHAGIAPGARLLDAGCGHGWYGGALAEHSYRVTGVDLAPGQLAMARATATPSSRFEVDRFEPRTGIVGRELAAASVLTLPFAAGTFDAAFAVNVLHHVGGRAAQDAALAELARVVRPGGLVFVHEISTVNPLYRLYMAYLFPLWKRIDLGTEVWLDPRRPPRADRLTLEAVQYYTFLPDFTPRPLYRWLEPAEAWLERSRFRGLAAHFTAIYHRLAEPAPLPLDGNVSTAGRAARAVAVVV
ncbi:MAG: flippase-like domain-containing protein [Chloroflexota bacterium]